MAHIMNRERKKNRMDDLISRQAAIDSLDEYIEEYSYDLDENGYHNPKWCAMQEAKMTIQRLPSAERRGRWINGNEGIWNAVILPKCSICGETFYEMNVNINGEYPYNYCPNCGARMEVE